MIRSTRGLAAALVLSALSATFAPADEPPSADTAPIQETDRSSMLRKVYFPFLAVGHGLFFIVEYGVAYPIYYVAKPAVDFIYSSSDDPADFPNSVGKQQH